jgi:hypothetical protein
MSCTRHLGRVNQAVPFRQVFSAIGELYTAGHRGAADLLDCNASTAGPRHVFASSGDGDPSVPIPDCEEYTVQNTSCIQWLSTCQALSVGAPDPDHPVMPTTYFLVQTYYKTPTSQPTTNESNGILKYQHLINHLSIYETIFSTFRT